MKDDNKLLAMFGLITDIQYADIKDGSSYDGIRLRLYRSSLERTKRAVAHWKQLEEETGRKVQFMLQLGDIIDGNCVPLGKSSEALDLVLNELVKLFPHEPHKKLLHLWGNHEMYNFRRDQLVNMPLNTARNLGHMSETIHSKANYYTYDVTSRLRLICLDFYVRSALGRDKSDPVHQQVVELLREHNKNDDLNSPDNLSDADSKYLLFNGSLGDEQLKWLRDELEKCRHGNVRAIVCGHIPLDARAGDFMCLPYDVDEIAALFGEYSDTIVAYFAGHYHSGSYFHDKQTNIQHFTFPAVLERSNESNAFATFYVYENRISVNIWDDANQYEIEY